MAKRNLPTFQPIPLFYPQATEPITHFLTLPLYLFFLPLQMLGMMVQGLTLPMPAMTMPRPTKPQSSSKTFYQNIEETLIWEDAQGKLHVVTKRKATRN